MSAPAPASASLPAASCGLGWRGTNSGPQGWCAAGQVRTPALAAGLQLACLPACLPVAERLSLPDGWHLIQCLELELCILLPRPALPCLPAVPREVGPPPGGPELVRSRVPVVFFTARGLPGESKDTTDTVQAALRALRLPGACLHACAANWLAGCMFGRLVSSLLGSGCMLLPFPAVHALPTNCHRCHFLHTPTQSQCWHPTCCRRGGSRGRPS
jgi:hypothetical protein